MSRRRGDEGSALYSLYLVAMSSLNRALRRGLIEASIAPYTTPRATRNPSHSCISPAQLTTVTAYSLAS